MTPQQLHYIRQRAENKLTAHAVTDVLDLLEYVAVLEKQVASNQPSSPRKRRTFAEIMQVRATGGQEWLG